MKNLILLFCLAGFFLLNNPVYGQDLKPSELYRDFVNDYREYQSALGPFETKKSRHLSLQTLATQMELMDTTRDLLTAETKAIYSYTAFVRGYLAEATKVLNYQENVIYLKLDDKISFFGEAKKRAQSLTQLSEASALDKELSEHYLTLSSLTYQIKSIIEIKSARKIYENLKIEKDKLNHYLDQTQGEQAKVAAAKEKLLILEGKLNQVDQRLQEAEKLQGKLNTLKNESRSKDIRKIIDQVMLDFEEVIQGFKNIVYSLK